METHVKSRRWDLYVSILSFAGMLLLWEVVCRTGLIEAVFLPAPSDVLDRAVKTFQQGVLLEHVLASTRRPTPSTPMTFGSRPPMSMTVIGSDLW